MRNIMSYVFNEPKAENPSEPLLLIDNDIVEWCDETGRKRSFLSNTLLCFEHWSFAPLFGSHRVYIFARHLASLGLGGFNFADNTGALIFENSAIFHVSRTNKLGIRLNDGGKGEKNFGSTEIPRLSFTQIEQLVEANILFKS